MNNLDQSLNYPTMSGLKSLELDELTTDSFISDTIDGNIIYYNLIEGNEIIVDTKLTLTNTGVISVGDYIISDIELTYLDGVSSNIQNQLNNLNNAVNNNNSLSGIVNLHTQQIQALQYQDISHNIKLNELYNRTRWQTTDLSSTIFTKKINLNNGNIGYVDQLYPNNFYVQSNLLSGNNIILNSGLANIFLQSQNIYLGKTDAITGRKSNLFMFDGNGILETQSSAFTELLKGQIIANQQNIFNLQYSDISQNTNIKNLQSSDALQNSNIINLQSSDTLQNTNIQKLQYSDISQNILIFNLQTNDTLQNTAITTLQSKTQHISSADTTSTNMNKPIYVTSEADCVRMIGNQVFFTGWNITQTTRHFAIGKETSTGSRMIIINNMEGELLLTSGKRSGNANFGQNKIITQSTGISLRRGGRTDAEIIVGEIGATGGASGTDANLYINGNGVNNINIDSGIGIINTVSTGLALSRTLNNIYYSGGVIGLINSGNNVFHITSNGTNDIYMDSGSGTTTITTTNNINLSSNTIYIGSITPAGNGYKTNLNFLEASGYTTQSSAFTEALKQQVLSSVNSSRLDAARDFTVSVGINTGFNAIGRTNLANSTVYGTGSTLLDVGALLNASYPTLFDAGGSYIGASPARYELLFYNEYLCLNSTVRQCRSRIRVYTSAGVNSGSFLDNSGYGGIDYTANSALHNLIVYNTSPFKFDFTTGQKIRVETIWMASTSSLGTANTMLGRFYMHRVIY